MPSSWASRLRRAAWGEPASGRSRATTSSGHTTRRGEGCALATANVAATCAAKTEVGETCCLSRPRCPPPWTRATRSVRRGAPPSGATVPVTTSATIPMVMTAAPMTAGPRHKVATRPEGGAERGDGDPARPHAGGDQQRAAEPGQFDERAAGLAQEHATERQPAEGPRHAHGLGQGARAHERRRTPAAGRRRGRGGREGEGLQEDENDGAVPVEGAGPGEPDGIAAQPGQPSGPDARPQ